MDDAHPQLSNPMLQEVVDDPGGNKMLLVMDYMEGGPVLTREGLERGRRVPEPLARQYFRDMCKVRAERAFCDQSAGLRRSLAPCHLVHCTRHRHLI